MGMDTKQKKVIAAFDFDGTISYSDSLLPFLTFTTGRLKTAWYLLLELPWMIGFLLKITSRQKTKEHILKRFFSKMPIEALKKQGELFATEELPKHIRPKALERLHWHLDQQHRCILISASIDTYLAPWAKQVGFDTCITSSLEIDSNNRITGNLQGLNCRGPEKVRRLIELVGQKNNYTLYAYGDSDGDKELLAFADHPFYRYF